MQILHHAQDILRLWISMDINGYHDLEDVDVVCLPDLSGHAKLREMKSLENACRFSKMLFHSDSGFFAADDGGFKTRFVLPSGNLT